MFVYELLLITEVQRERQPAIVAHTLTYTPIVSSPSSSGKAISRRFKKPVPFSFWELDIKEKDSKKTKQNKKHNNNNNNKQLLLNLQS